jgi:Ribbon-helix-helix protein, copG family
MTASKHSKMLSVRLPEPELRRIKSLAANRGVSLQEAVQEALEAWSAQLPTALPPLDALQGSLAGVDLEQLRRRESKAERIKDRRWS